MRKIILISMVLFGFSIISCSTKPEVQLETEEVFSGVLAELPSKFIEEKEGLWINDKDILIFRVPPFTVRDVEDDLKQFASQMAQKEEMHKGMVFMKSLDVQNKDLNGKIDIYERKFEGGGTGLITYDVTFVFALVQSNQKPILVQGIATTERSLNSMISTIKSLREVGSAKEVSGNDVDVEKFRKDGYQIFEDFNFVIKSHAKLKLDTTMLEYFRKNSNLNSQPYHIKYKGVDYNVNISDFSSLYHNAEPSLIDETNEQYILDYKTNLDSYGIKNYISEFKGMKAVYYENMQNGIKSKAVFFHHYNKAYMLQVSSKTDIDNYFKKFIGTFELIKK